MNLTNFVVVSPDGSWFPAANAMLLNTTLLNHDEMDTLCEGSDYARWALCSDLGERLKDVIK